MNNKVQITLLLCLGLGLAFAQTGLIGLSYGDSFEKASGILSAAGFTNDSGENGPLHFFSPDEVVYQVRLGIDESDCITDWTVVFYSGYAQMAIDVLIDWHGDVFTNSFDDFSIEYWIWELEGGKSVEAFVNPYDDRVYVNYF